MTVNTNEKTIGTPIEVEDAQEITPHNQALYEAGKKLLVDSVDVGREFCKFMTTTTLGAIPVYIALLKLVLPKDYSLKTADEVLFLVPPIMFLVSAIIFVVGYFPEKGKLSLDLPEEIERERSSTVTRRHRRAIVAFIFLCAGIIIGGWLLVDKLMGVFI